MAANTRDIRRRIKSVKNTAQITKAMQMVAASKMRRAQTAALAGRPYADRLNAILASLKPEDGSDLTHPLLEQREGGKELVIVIATDKGLCGALNTNLFREVGKFDPANTIFITIGRKAAQFLLRGQRTLAAEFELKDNFHFREAQQVSKFALEKFLSGEVSKVTVAFSDFVNTLVQNPRTRTVLPVTSLEATLAIESNEPAKPATPAPVAVGDTSDYKFEPDITTLLGSVLPHFVHFQVYQMALDARASEHSARMVAMKNATDNAKQLIKDLTLEYNKVRQASITTEILEIATAQMVLG
jgi:F-type H+-transporting ATPase subunit gamma